MTITPAAESARAAATFWPDDVRTLGVDVGGSGLKAAVLDAHGNMISDRVRVDTPYPCSPDRLAESLVALAEPLPDHHRVTVGFPGLVRHGRVGNIPSLTRTAYDGDTDPALVQLWTSYPLAERLSRAFDLPTKVANDADVQGCGAVRGHGFEFVMTLGTGVGTALFSDGRLAPHLEMGHAQFKNGSTFEEQLGNVARKDVGNERWTRRVLKAIAAYNAFLFFDTIYIGGGNAKHLEPEELPTNAVIVPNTAGITGGVRLWELDS